MSDIDAERREIASTNRLFIEFRERVNDGDGLDIISQRVALDYARGLPDDYMARWREQVNDGRGLNINVQGVLLDTIFEARDIRPMQVPDDCGLRADGLPLWAVPVMLAQALGVCLLVALVVLAAFLVAQYVRTGSVDVAGFVKSYAVH